MAICAFVSSGSDGVRLYIYENIRKDRQCLGIGITSFFTFSGTFIASISAAYFSSQDLEWYEWKYSFLIGAILGLAVIMLMKFMDYQDVHKVQTDSQYNEYKNIPLLRVIKINWKLFLYSMMAIGAIGATNQFLIIFFGTYCFKVLAINEQHAMQSIISKGVVLIMFSCLLAGYIADKFNRLTIALLAASILSVLTYYQGSYIEQGQVSACIFWISSFVLPFLHMPAAAIIKEAIPKVIRYRLFSFSHAIGSIIISAPTAFLATLVYHHSEVKFAPFIYFIFILFLLSLGLCLLYKKEIK
jgi:MFS family permease